jgi:hypothetical protein
MDRAEFDQQRAAAAELLGQHENRQDATRLVASLADGLDLLRDALYIRLHDDVEKILGEDSMLSPISEQQTKAATKTEIELYQIAVSAATIQQHAYLSTHDQWHLEWLTTLRLGASRSEAKALKRLAQYVSATLDEQRLAFTDVLARVLPESSEAPLVLFRLLPLCVQIATALAFGDQATAAQTRDQQAEFLPAIRDCRQCHGSLLENGRQCDTCGNPLWKFAWLTASD